MTWRLGLVLPGAVSYTPVSSQSCASQNDPPPTPLTLSMLFLQRVRLTFAIAVFGADSLMNLVVPHLWAAADITAAHSRRPHTQVPLRLAFPPRAHSDYLWHSTVVPVPAAVPIQPGQFDCRREQAQLPLSPLAPRPSSLLVFSGFL
jgi:hypothetical protein